MIYCIAIRLRATRSSSVVGKATKSRRVPRSTSLLSNGTGGEVAGTWSKVVASIWYRKSGIHDATDLLAHSLNGLINKRGSFIFDRSAYIHIFARGCKNCQLRKFFFLEQSLLGDNKQWGNVHCAPSQCLLVCPYQLAAQRCNNLAANSSTTNGITFQLHHCASACYSAWKRWQCWGRHLASNINMYEDISCWKCDK